jgi:hypothetical protein
MDRFTKILIVVVLALLLLGGSVVAVRALSKSELAKRANLLPEVRAALDALRSVLSLEGIETFVGSTRRTPDEQKIKMEQGSSTTENSWHLLGRAVDLYPIDPETGEYDGDARTWDTLFRRMHELAPRFGFRGLAFNADGGRRYLTRKDGSKFWDGPHLEFSGGMTFAKAKARSDASGGTA